MRAQFRYASCVTPRYVITLAENTQKMKLGKKKVCSFRQGIEKQVTTKVFDLYPERRNEISPATR